MKTTLLQQLLIETLPKEEKGSILEEFIKTMLPSMETHFSLIPALGGKEAKFAKKQDQSLMVHVLNGLITAWNLSKYLDEELSEEEQKTLCLGFTLHDYDKYNYYCPITETPKAHKTEEIINLCYELGEKLEFSNFWEKWEDHLLDICFLAQNTQGKNGSNLNSGNWEIDNKTFQISFPDREKLCELLRFGDIAVHLNDPAGAALPNPRGKALQNCLDSLDIDKKIVYHRLRDCRGLITNNIHNAVVKFAKKRGWQPILYFAQGTAYLADVNTETPSLLEIQETTWNKILQGEPENNIEGLSSYFNSGEVGFIRDGKGLKIAPLTRELFSPSELICQLPSVIKNTVKNLKSLATPKRLEKLDFPIPELEKISLYADIWADRLAEFLILTQREFFNNEQKQEFTNWVLTHLGLANSITYEQAQSQSGGVIYGWYYVATSYLATEKFNQDPESAEMMDFMKNFAKNVANWAEENKLLPAHKNPTLEAFNDYLADYLELSGWQQQNTNFNDELNIYTNAKTQNKPICSISSGDMGAEDQLDSVVLFKPQQYSNKNALGGGRIKRGISKVWSLEMLMRQADWSAPAGKLEDNKPVFLYIFPAYVYSPQVACAVGIFAKKMEKISLWDVIKLFKNSNLKLDQLKDLDWYGKKAKAGRYGDDYSTTDLPFMAIHHTTTMGKTDTDAWVEPAFKALALAQLLGVKVVATTSNQPLYRSDQEFLETVKLDGVAGFWNLLGLNTNLRLQDIDEALRKLLIIYSIHLDNRSSKPDARWQALNSTVREVMTDVLNIFAIANEGLRKLKRDPYPEEVKLYWIFVQIWISKSKNQNQPKLQGELIMDFVEELTRKYRQFYKVYEDESGNIHYKESSHSILRPISIALEVILRTPPNTDKNTLIQMGCGQIFDALERLKDKEVSKRVLRKDTAKEHYAIKDFMQFFVEEVLGDIETKEGYCKGDRAVLQENCNRIKSALEWTYREFALEEKSGNSPKEN